MSYEIFARKYRPWKFEEVVGQLSVVRTIQNAISSGRIAQAYLFSGVRGTGKTTVARILAKALNCADGPTPHPCPDRERPCQFCKAIHEGSAIDVIEIDGASNRQVDDIEPIREMVKYKPAFTRTKVLIIDEVHMLSTHAFNALLKTLEEPPPNTVFIFATTEFNKVPATIVSRCQHFEFRKISRKDIINHLMEIAKKEGITITPSGLALIAEAADGSMRDAQSLLDQAVAFSGENIGDEDLKTILGTIGQDVLMRFSTAVLDGTPEAVFGLVEGVVTAGYDLRFVFGKLVEHFRALLLVRSVEKPEDFLAVSPEGLAALRTEAAKAGPEDLLRCLLALQQAEPGLKYSAAPRIYFEAFFVKLCHFRKIVPLQDLIRDVEALKGAPAVPAARTAGPERQAGPSPAAGPAAPPARPAPAKPEAPAPKDVFARVLENLAVDRAPLAAMLGQYSSVMIKDNAIEVSFASGRGFFVTSLQDKDMRAVERAASDVLGREIKVRFAEENASGGGPLRPGRELESAMKDPAVQFFMNTFKAQVLSADQVPAGRDGAAKGRGPTEKDS
ncbi:MAG TPA: DNA polymerase III subunit gamma/tau [Candidatus Aminicenantes bacterium]|nr:DNA polymerase III subunit gamma/tau [Candidatus Aminicenantes bacterium]HRY65245.1 DNA polymerase III subunit gamma/tau [Candidatus Aminicenantes bacterium]HRZ72287.1 DNA polymerase III subunit gamma/tau [Candidatus Aminicenantes bacterium]